MGFIMSTYSSGRNKSQIEGKMLLHNQHYVLFMRNAHLVTLLI